MQKWIILYWIFMFFFQKIAEWKCLNKNMLTAPQYILLEFNVVMKIFWHFTFLFSCDLSISLIFYRKMSYWYNFVTMENGFHDTWIHQFHDTWNVTNHWLWLADFKRKNFSQHLRSKLIHFSIFGKVLCCIVIH